VLWGVHALARRAVLPAPEEPPGIRRSYAALMLAVFSLTDVVAVPAAVSQVAATWWRRPASLLTAFLCL
jgi:hypothetical protein